MKARVLIIVVPFIFLILLATAVAADSASTDETSFTLSTKRVPDAPGQSFWLEDNGSLQQLANGQNLTGSQNVELIGQIGGALSGVAIQGNYAYIGIGPRLEVLDISDPAAPIMLGQTEIISESVVVVDLAVNGNFVYVVSGDSGLHIINISNPSFPIEVGSYNTPGRAFEVVVVGSYAYIADYDNGLRIINITNPSAPTEVGSYDTPGYATGVRVAGNYAYVADGERLRIVNIASPANPYEVGSYDTPGWAWKVAIMDGNAYVADNSGLRIINVSNPMAPYEVGFINTTGSGGQARDVAVAGNYAYIVNGWAGSFYIINITNPAAPSTVGLYETSGDTYHVTLGGSYAYITDLSQGLRILNIANPITPTETSFYQTFASAFDVVKMVNHAYIAGGKGGLRIINVANPAIPIEVGFYDTPGEAIDVAVEGDYGYIADRGGGLRIIDITNLATPTEVSFFEIPGYARGVAVAGNNAFIAQGPSSQLDPGGLRIINITDPANPTESGFFETPGGTFRDLVVGGNFAYIAEDRYWDGSQYVGGGLRIINILNPANPTNTGFYDTPGDYIQEIAIRGNLVYVADGDGGLRIINVANPATPTEVGFLDMPASAEGVTVDEGYAYVSTFYGGLRVIDITDPTNPIEAGFYNMTGAAYGVTSVGQYIYVASYDGGLFILRFTRVESPLSQPVQAAVNDAISRLNQVLVEADEIADDGDFFGVEKEAHEIELVADAIIDSVGILAEGFDVVQEVEDLTKMQMPGVAGRGWGHVLAIKASHEEARDAFRDALLLEVTGANAQRAAKEFLNGAHIYYAADMLDTVAENLLTDGMIKYGWQVGLQNDLALQAELYPSHEQLVNAFTQDLLYTRDTTINNLPILTPEEVEAYIEDLNQREKAHIVMAFTLERRALPLHLARDDRENGQGNWIAEFLTKYLIKGLAFLYADGPGVLAVEVGSAYWNLYQNSRQLEEDIKMMNLGVEGMGGALDTEKRIYLNTVHGLDNIVLGIPPQIAQGNLSSISHFSEGEYKIFGSWCSWCWFERSSYSELALMNSTNYDTVYQGIARYGSTGFLGTSYQPLLSEGVKVISGNGTNNLRIYYKRGDESVSPDINSTIEINVLGSTDTGTYFVLLDSTAWNPVRITSFSRHEDIWLASGDTPSFPYPIRNRIAINETDLTYTPYIWVDNPFTTAVTVTLSQVIPANIEVIDLNGGNISGNTLTWQQTITPLQTIEITHTFRYSGQSGQVVSYPEPQLEMTDLGATAYISFTGEVENFVNLLPLSATGMPPRAIVPEMIFDIPFTVTNHIADAATMGAIGLTLIDFKNETTLYSTAQNVNVPANGNLNVTLPLNAVGIPEDDYLLVATLESNGGSQEIFSAYLKVSFHKLYLPTIAR